MFILTPTRLLFLAISHAGITTRRLFTNTFPQLSQIGQVSCRQLRWTEATWREQNFPSFKVAAKRIQTDETWFKCKVRETIEIKTRQPNSELQLPCDHDRQASDHSRMTSGQLGRRRPPTIFYKKHTVWTVKQNSRFKETDIILMLSQDPQYTNETMPIRSFRP